MRLSRAFALVLFAGIPTASAAAQIPPGGSISARPATPLPRMMVSNPYALRTTDSATSVQIGTALRNRMDRIANNVYNVLSREQMNEALLQYTYGRDAILTPAVQRQFAQALSARVLLSSTMARGQSGNLQITARLAGLNDDAGTVVTVTQAPGQSPADLGTAVANEFEKTIKSAKDAKACVDQRTSDPKKAADAARRALNTTPRNGLAYYCLAQLAIDAKLPSDSIIALLKKAVEGDPQSLPALAVLAQQYQARSDTAHVIEAYQAMLRAAPANEELRKEAFRYFLTAGRTDAARQVVEEALAADEYNPELYDLLSNVCVFENNYSCAVDALEKLYAIDSTKADSTFYLKISVFASQPTESPDTTRLIKWASAGVRKYPTNVTLLNQLLGAYAMKGQMDSATAIATRLTDLDTTTVAPLLLIINQLAQQDSLEKAMPLLDLVARRGSPQDKENAAILLVNKSFEVLRAPPTDSGIGDTLRLGRAANLARRALQLTDSTSRLWPSGNYALGLSLVFLISKIDPAAERAKSCDLARKEDGLVQEAGPALEAGRPSDTSGRIDQYVQYITSLKPRTASMIRAYCR